MSALAPQQVAALRELDEACAGTPFVLVGAMALVVTFERWEGTRDLDLVVTASVEELGDITGRLTGWQRNTRLEHEWRTPGGVTVDILPAGNRILADRKIVWPESGHEMNMTGFRLLADWYDSLAVADDLVVRVAPVAAIALLKMVAYLDRPDRDRDLRDIAHIWDGYAERTDRLFSDEVINEDIDVESAGAFLVGLDLAQRINTDERDVAERFLGKLVHAEEGDLTLEKMRRQGPSKWRQDSLAYVVAAEAMRKGLS